jgi:hypothetical protein
MACPGGKFAIFTILFTAYRVIETGWPGQTDVGLLCVYTYTQMSLLLYLIWACNNVYAFWVTSAFACLMLEIGKQGCHSDESIWFWSVITNDRILYGKSREKMLPTDILNLICDNAIRFNQRLS